MDDRSLIARAYRRVAFGAVGGTLEAEVSAGTAALRAKLLTPDAAGVPTAQALWAGDFTVLPTEKNPKRKELSLKAIHEWVDHLVASPRPHLEWRTWFWHGHFVTNQIDVANPQFMVDNILLLRTAGGGSFPDLLTAITTDAAMLLYLDGNDNAAEAPNENYSREVLELFTLGIGNYTEADIDAGSSALTGYRMDPKTHAPRFWPKRHDDAGQDYLGATGVNSVDGVVAAITANPALAPFLAGRFARQIIGPSAPADVVATAASTFTSSGFKIEALIGSLVDSLLAGADGGSILSAPFPWFIAARRATGSTANGDDVFDQLRSVGQMPWYCPTVAGWPYDQGWQTTATQIGRFDLASLIVDSTPPDSPSLAVAESGDLVALALLLGLPADFSPTTAEAITSVNDPRGRLVLALTSPEFVNV